MYQGIFSSILYAGLGLVMLMVVYVIIDMMTPGRLQKHLTEEKNVALAVVVGSAFIGVSIIIAAAIHG